VKDLEEEEEKVLVLYLFRTRIKFHESPQCGCSDSLNHRGFRVTGALVILSGFRGFLTSSADIYIFPKFYSGFMRLVSSFHCATRSRTSGS